MHHILPAYSDYMRNAFSGHVINQAIRDLNASGVIWVVAPWDSYEEEFLSCVNESSVTFSSRWLKLDFGSYKNLASFAESVNGVEGFTLGDFCKLVSGDPSCTLLLDNIPNYVAGSRKPVIEEAVSIANFIKKKVPSIRIVLRTRAIAPSIPLWPLILRAMDEPDCNKFIMTHPLAGRVPESSMAAGEIYFMSGGLPGVVQKILEQLAYTSLSVLANETSDMAVRNVDLDEIPQSLIDTLEALKSSSSPDLHALLECLCLFPHGEDISQLKNFRRTRPFYPKQSAALVALGLVDAVTHGFFEQEEADLPKVICQVRPAQNYVRSQLGEEYQGLTEYALGLYFGKEWRLGTPKLGASFSKKVLSEFEYSTRNACSLLRRLYNDALMAHDPRQLSDSLELIGFYTRKLENICYFRQICTLCYVLIPRLLEMLDSHLVQDIVFRYANSLRMLDELDKALELYLTLLGIDSHSRQRKGRILLHVAMVHDDKNDSGSAIKYARDAQVVAGMSSTFQHAESIILCHSKAKTRQGRLRNLNKICNGVGQYHTANNIEFRMASEFEGGARRKEIYLSMANRALGQDDKFNFVKATIYYCELAIREGEQVSSDAYKKLLSCYDFVRSQRMGSMFKNAHRSLWKILEAKNNIGKLAHLFTLSSVTYRLSGDESSEREYLNKILALSVLNSPAVSSDHRGYISRRMDVLRVGQAGAAAKERPNLMLSGLSTENLSKSDA